VNSKVPTVLLSDSVFDNLYRKVGPVGINGTGGIEVMVRAAPVVPPMAASREMATPDIEVPMQVNVSTNVVATGRAVSIRPGPTLEFLTKFPVVVMVLAMRMVGMLVVGMATVRWSRVVLPGIVLTRNVLSWIILPRYI
jgi:hypothetical protein